MFKFVSGVAVGTLVGTVWFARRLVKIHDDEGSLERLDNQIRAVRAIQAQRKAGAELDADSSEVNLDALTDLLTQRFGNI